MTTAYRKKKSSKRGSSNSNIGLWLIGVSVAIVALVVLVIVVNEQRARSAPVAQPDVPAEWINRTSLGSPDAKVVMQAWEDFMCPSCQNWAKSVEPLIIEEYIKPGNVRLEFHHFPLQQHAPGSFLTAQAAECAADQGMFWPYQDKLFRIAEVDGQGGVQFENLIGYARDMGMNEQQFTNCLSSQQHLETVNQSVTQAGQLNLQFTPSILIDGELLQDSSYPALKAQLDAKLAAAGQ